MKGYQEKQWWSFRCSERFTAEVALLLNLQMTFFSSKI
jgi:hypothetical protein